MSILNLMKKVCAWLQGFKMRADPEGISFFPMSPVRRVINLSAITTWLEMTFPLLQFINFMKHHLSKNKEGPG